jgi:hypothetical protein
MVSEVMTSERFCVIDTNLNVSYAGDEFVKIYHTGAEKGGGAGGRQIGQRN